MREIQLSEDTFRKLVILKNHWTFHHGRVTNPEVTRRLEEAKLKIFGYNSSTPVEEMEKIANSKSRDQLEGEAEEFAEAVKTLLSSGLDFDPRYTLEDHVKKMIDVINEGDVPPPTL